MSEKKKRKRIPFLLILITGILISGYAEEKNIHRYNDVRTALEYDAELSSHSAVMVELSENRVCYSKNPYEKLPIASLTKIMTALVTIENSKDLEAEYTFTAGIIDRMEECNASVAGFLPGERVSLRELLYGAMLPSGGDAALGLAVMTAGCEGNMVELMNKRAAELGMTDTHFSDVTGLDDSGNYSTASDMALLFSVALENEIFRETVTEERYLTRPTEQHPDGILLTSTLSEPAKEYSLEGRISGGKTGYTMGAGLCLASYAEGDGHRYILVTLGAGDGNKYPSYHFEDAALLYDRYYKA